jgi:hypothetical protein
MYMCIFVYIYMYTYFHKYIYIGVDLGGAFVFRYNMTQSGMFTMKVTMKNLSGIIIYIYINLYLYARVYMCILTFIF